MTIDRKCNEKSSMLAKLALGTGRSMDIKITDASGAPLMNITRPFKLWHKSIHNSRVAFCYLLTTTRCNNHRSFW